MCATGKDVSFSDSVRLAHERCETYIAYVQTSLRLKGEHQLVQNLQEVLDELRQLDRLRGLLQ
jgi:hypothetical protein